MKTMMDKELELKMNFIDFCITPHLDRINLNAIFDEPENSSFIEKIKVNHIDLVKKQIEESKHLPPINSTLPDEERQTIRKSIELAFSEVRSS